MPQQNPISFSKTYDMRRQFPGTSASCSRKAAWHDENGSPKPHLRNRPLSRRSSGKGVTESASSSLCHRVQRRLSRQKFRTWSVKKRGWRVSGILARAHYCKRGETRTSAAFMITEETTTKHFFRRQAARETLLLSTFLRCSENLLS
jgi:hypothetical protein